MGQRKVAIVGCDIFTRADAPWDDSAWEIWGLNGAHTSPDIHRTKEGDFRADYWFQIHPPATWSAAEMDWLEMLESGERTVPTYVREQDLPHIAVQWPRAVQQCRAYPLTRVREAFPKGVFASTFCWEIALALVAQYTDIALYGVDSRALGRELVVERPALWYWQGVADTRGIRLTFPGSTLKKYSYGYGFDYLREAAEAAMLTELILPRRWLRDAATLDNNLDTTASVEKMAKTLEESLIGGT